MIYSEPLRPSTTAARARKLGRFSFAFGPRFFVALLLGFVALGPAWWFYDSPEGMRRFRELTTETAGFYNTVGFNDDTRAFWSLQVAAFRDDSRRKEAAVQAVECAFGGHDALLKASSQAYDAIFLDVRMPDLDGVELGRVLTRFASPPQLVFVSAHECE